MSQRKENVLLNYNIRQEFYFNLLDNIWKLQQTLEFTHIVTFYRVTVFFVNKKRFKIFHI